MFNVNEYKQQLKDVENTLSQRDTLSDSRKMAELSREYMRLKEIVDVMMLVATLQSALKEAQRILADSNDAELVAFAEAETIDLTQRISTLEQEVIALIHQPDPDDSRNVIMEIRAGAGGDEAALFGNDLMTMYARYAERHNAKVEILSMNRTELKGMKEIVARIAGKNVYRDLKYESGVHRVQRIPETEKNGRIHTSTATVAVLPEVTDIEITIDPKDLRIDTYLASGKGGQNVQKNETAVRITHIPSGIVAASQSERSQLQNRANAMNMLQARLYAKEKEERDASRADTRRDQVGSADRSEKIRTYNFPQDRMTDHRINESWHNLENILAGNLDEVIARMRRYEMDQITKS